MPTPSPRGGSDRRARLAPRPGESKRSRAPAPNSPLRWVMLASAGVLCLLLVAVAFFALRGRRKPTEASTAPPLTPAATTLPPAPTRTPPNFLFGSLVASAQPPASPSARHYPPPWERLPRQETVAVTKRRSQRTRDVLLRQLADASVLSLERAGDAQTTAETLRRRVADASLGTKRDPTLELIASLPEFAGLPWRRGEECRLSVSQSRDLDTYSAALRDHTSKAITLQKILWKTPEKSDTWAKSEAVPTLMQMLTPEESAVRGTLVRQLGRIEGKEASEGLARIALFDCEEEVREQAVIDLARRPTKEYLSLLLSGFSHPWPPVADHAAEAIVALRVKEAVPTLVSLLDAADPRDVYQKPGGEQWYLKEMIRIEHTKNCLLCHPPSFGPNDQPRTTVPGGEPRAYYPDGTGTFVRADVSYLKQDYSVALLTGSPRSQQKSRFDFIVRERMATRHDLDDNQSRLRDDPNSQRKAVLFALTNLTGRNLGTNAAAWKEALQELAAR